MKNSLEKEYFHKTLKTMVKSTQNELKFQNGPQNPLQILNIILYHVIANKKPIFNSNFNLS